MLSSTSGLFLRRFLSSKPPLTGVVKSFVRLIHPDRFQDPKAQAANMEALATFNQFMDTWRTWDASTPESSSSIYDLDFYIHRSDLANTKTGNGIVDVNANNDNTGDVDNDSGNGNDNDKKNKSMRVQARLYIQPPIHSGHDSLRHLFQKCGLPTEFDDSGEALPSSNSFSSIGSFLRSSLPAAKKLTDESDAAASSNAASFSVMKERHGFRSMFCDTGMTQIEIAAEVAKLRSLSDAGHLKSMPLADLDIVFTGPEDGDGPSETFISLSGSITFSAAESADEWLEQLRNTDWKSIAKRMKAKARQIAEFKKSLTIREKRIARVFAIGSFSFGLHAKRGATADTVPPPAFKLLDPSSKEVLTAAKRRNWGPKAHKQLKVVVSKMSFLDGIYSAVSPEGELLISCDARPEDVVRAIAGGAEKAHAVTAIVRDLEPKRRFSEHVLGLERLAPSEDFFDKDGDAALDRIVRAYGELETVSPALSANITSLDGLTMLIGAENGEFSVDREGNLVVPWDFEFEEMRQFLIGQSEK